MSSFRLASSAYCILAGICLSTAELTVAVNDYVGIPYENEPVSFDWTLPAPVPVGRIGIPGRPSQVEILAGTPDAVSQARVWTQVSFPYVNGKPGPGTARHLLLILRDDLAEHTPVSPIAVTDAGQAGGVPLAEWNNGRIRVVAPQGETVFSGGVSALDIPGPVVRIARGAEPLVGNGYLDCIQQVLALRCTSASGPVYHETRLCYEFAGGGTYTSRVRLYAGKPYVTLNEDFDLGGNARYVFNYQDWPVDGSFFPGDSRRYHWRPLTDGEPCNDFVTLSGQRALSRLVVWSQFNYFGGKQETVALKQPDPASLDGAFQAAHAKWLKDAAKWDGQQEAWKTKPPAKGIPPRPVEPVKPTWQPAQVLVDGVAMPTSAPTTPGGDATAIGGFYIRPDRWTRAKLNHVDLYLRPEVLGDRLSRGITGLAGAVLRPALEAWLVSGHREWALFAVRAGDENWLARAHVLEGVWPLDRLNRLPLAWNSDGSAVAPAATCPGAPAGGAAGQVLLGTGGRSGLQFFNGSNPHIRGRSPKAGGTATTVVAEAGANPHAGAALDAYLASDDSAYPSHRAMLPWSDAEALNPFYQGMENMNFNADLYRWVAAAGFDLKRLGHPEADRFIAHGRDSLDLALDTYVYPQSGCWEESHGYAGHTVGVVTPLAAALRDAGLGNFFEDPRFLGMVHFFTRVYSPIDSVFGNRVVPPIGDHGLSTADPADRLGKLLTPFAGVQGGTARQQLAEIAGLVAESGGKLPEGVEPAPVVRRSGWLQGYGSVLHAAAPGGLLQVELPGAMKRDKDGAISPLVLLLPQRGGSLLNQVTVQTPGHNQGKHRGTVTIAPDGNQITVTVEASLGADKHVGGAGTGTWTITLRRTAEGWSGGAFSGTLTSDKHSVHAVQGEAQVRSIGAESFCVVRAGQSWGHHHEDKGSLWFWGRGAHFFGDCSWGSPPGGTYGNPFKQGPASGTQIELEGITNWTLPCKYPAAWVADGDYGDGVDFVLARCLYPFNAELRFEADAPVALSQGYDRHVLFVHPDLLVVHDHIDTACPTVWRLHSYHKEATTVTGSAARIATPCGLHGELSILHPAGAVLEAIDAFPEIHPYTGRRSDYAGQPFSSRMLQWRMPRNASATWSFLVHDATAAAPAGTVLDPTGAVTRHVLQDGREVVAILSGKPLSWTGDGLTFAGTVGVAIRTAGGAWATRGIRGSFTP